MNEILVYGIKHLRAYTFCLLQCHFLATEFGAVQKEVAGLVQGRVLVGHSLKYDLKVRKMNERWSRGVIPPPPSGLVLVAPEEGHSRHLTIHAISEAVQGGEPSL